jgi:hypothetical protein
VALTDTSSLASVDSFLKQTKSWNGWLAMQWLTAPVAGQIPSPI